jgi:hypothetical protein
MTNKITIQHVVDREVLHFAWSYAITDWVWLGLAALHRLSEKHSSWIQYLVPNNFFGLYGAAILLVTLFAFLREPRDVQEGDPAWKSYVDFSGWLVGGIIAALVNFLKTRIAF